MRLAAALALAMIGGCASTPRAAPSASACGMESAAFLRGRWCGAHRDGVFCEAWRDVPGGMVGEGAFTRGGAGGFSEALRIEPRGGVVSYVARPEGEAETAFRLVRCGVGEAVFENPAHDFPQRLSYRRVGADGLAIVVEGAARRVTFALSRVP